MLIRGVVRSDQGHPLGWASVAFVSGPVNLADIAALTSDDGEFALTAPVPGSYGIGCRADDHDYSVLDVDVGRTDVFVEVELMSTGQTRN